jgi:hypothetical protein
MWNLSGDDIQRAKEELKGRRAAVQARYDSEMKQLDSKIDEIEAFERAAQAFLANFQVGDGGEAAADEAAAEPAGAGEREDEAAAEPAGDQGVDAARGRAPAENRSSRWRMRLGTSENSP